MSPYLARLKALLATDDPEKGQHRHLPKLTEAPIVSFVSACDSPFLHAGSNAPCVAQHQDHAPIAALDIGATQTGEELASPIPSPIHDPGAMLECDFQERAAILEFDAGLPRPWAEMFARQLVKGPPGDFSPTRWQTAIDAALVFADQWGAEAFRLGWEAEDVFGLHPVAPAARYDCRGLAWLLGDGSRVVAIDADGADTVSTSGAQRRFYRRRR